MASSSTGGSAGGSGGGSRPPGSGGQPPRGVGGAGGGGTGGQPPYGGQSRPTRPGAPAGQERFVSYQREEERYWTDYLRIALPIIGLLLMLGLFWYWASSLIGDDDDDPNLAAASPTLTQIITAPTQTATTSVPADISPTETTPLPAEDPTAVGTEEADGPPQNGEVDDPAEEPTEAPAEPDQAGEFAEGDTVTVDTDILNMRAEPSEDGEVIAELVEGEELEVTGPSVPGDNYVWVPVVDLAGNEGYVAGDFLAPSE